MQVLGATMLSNIKTNGMCEYSKWFGAMQVERLTAEGLAALRLVVRFTGVDKLVETAGVRVLARRFALLTSLLWIGEDRQVLCELVHGHCT